MEPNRTPDEMYMATQPKNKQNISHCLQKRRSCLTAGNESPSCRAGATPARPRPGVARRLAQPRTAGTERKGGRRTYSSPSPAKRRGRNASPAPVSRRYGPGKGEDWLIARAVGFIVLSRSCSGSEASVRREGNEASKVAFEARGGDVVLGYGVTRVPTPAW